MTDEMWPGLLAAAIGGGTVTEVLRWLFFGRSDSAATLAGASKDIAESYARLVDELEEMRAGQKVIIAEMFAWKQDAQRRLVVLETENKRLREKGQAMQERLTKIEQRLCQVEKEAKQLTGDLIDSQRIRLRSLREAEFLDIAQNG